MSPNEPSDAVDRPRHNPPISLGAGAVIVQDRRVLLVRNIHGVTKGRYLLPAGRLEPNEPPDRAAAREVLEETNLRVEIAGMLGVRLWIGDDGEQNYFFMFLAKLCSPVSDLRPNLAEIDDARFFSLQELQALGKHETWSGAVAIALKALEPEITVWPNHATLSDRYDGPTDRWRIWM